MPKKTGRPLKLTKDRSDRIVSAIRAGNYAEVASRYGGVHPTSYYSYMKRGETDADAGKTTVFAEFFTAVKKAEADAEVRAVALVNTAMKDNWTAAMTYLERRFPQRWGRREVVEHAGEGGGPIGVRVVFGGRYKPDGALDSTKDTAS